MQKYNAVIIGSGAAGYATADRLLLNGVKNIALITYAKMPAHHAMQAATSKPITNYPVQMKTALLKWRRRSHLAVVCTVILHLLKR